MIHELLSILCCPETHQPLQMAEAGMIAELNEKIKAGQVKNRAGKSVVEVMEAGLVRQDRKFLYPVRGNIPAMVIDEAIPL